MVSDDTRPSRTQQKKQSLALQELGVELVALNDAQLLSMRLPDRLHEAVAAAKRMTQFEARRRQMQYIGKLMRSVDPEPIRVRLEEWKSSARVHTARLHRIERWRERLLSEDQAIAEFTAAYPQADAQQLRTLVRNAKREHDEGRPPRSYRALFHLIRDTLKAKEDRASDESE